MSLKEDCSYIYAGLFLAGLVIFVIDSVCGGLIGLFVLLGYFNFWEVSWFFHAGAYLFLIAGSFVLLSRILRQITQKTS